MLRILHNMQITRSVKYINILNMNKRLFMMMAISSVLAFSACDKAAQDGQGEHDPTSDEDITRLVAYNGLEYLQGGIAVVNKKEEVIRRIYGKPLDSSDTSIISIPVTNIERAENIFKGWIAPGKEAVKVDGGWDYKLTDENGNQQGGVSFRKIDSEGVIARMYVNEGTDLKHISEVNFISNDLWPENDAVKEYQAGQIYELDAVVISWLWSHPKNDYLGTYETVKRAFYCVQGNSNGKEAILVWLCPDDDREESHPCPSAYISRNLYELLPSVTEAEKVLDFYNANGDKWRKMLEDMDNKGYQWSAASGYATTGNDEFLLNSYNGKKIKCLDLDGDVGYIGEVKQGSWYKYRYMHIRIFPPYIEQQGDESGILR